jgi:hypothetical protein
LQAISANAFIIPLSVDNTFTIGSIKLPNGASLVWLVTPLAVFRLYASIMLRQSLVKNGLSLVNPKTNHARLWGFPRYSVGRGAWSN